jgi:succinate dehydrogenase / fumarate reductase membrane anchor subunit
MGNGTSIGKVRGLGSAHSGAHHWLVQRFTAIGNLVLVVWFVASIALLPNLNYATVIEWITRPVPATALALMVICTVWHARLGVQVLIEDYVHEHANKLAAIVALNGATWLGAAFGVVSIIRIALGAH